MNWRGTRNSSRLVRLGVVAGLALTLTACESDSFLFDPSVLGRWEHTPTRVPILTRIASIEGPDDEFVQVTDVRAEDLLPEITEYRIGPGDRLIVLVYDIPDQGRQAEYQPVVDSRGFINVPQLGEISVNGRTIKEAEAAVMESMKDLVANPLAAIRLEAPRQQRFSVFGGVQSPGQYSIPVADYKILEGLTAAGGFSEAPEYIYVIRQVPLTSGAAGVRPTPVRAPASTTPPRPGENLSDIIQDLAQPKDQPKSQPQNPPAAQPSSPPPAAPKPPPGSPSRLARAAQPSGSNPPIDLIDPKAPARPAAESRPAESPAASSPSADGSWVFLNGQWVKVARRTESPAAVTAADVLPEAGGGSDALVSQRVIRVPIDKLVSGDARYNIVLRPGDIVRVPPAPAGTVFIGGQISRAGSYQVQDRLTITALVTSAGGLTQTAVPERVDLRRTVGDNQQAIIRLDLRAIAEGTHPNIYLKANDEITIGTNFWATPMAIIRNGFRFTYGFGFLIDRNFGNDIFGSPPVNQFGQ